MLSVAIKILRTSDYLKCFVYYSEKTIKLKKNVYGG